MPALATHELTKDYAAGFWRTRHYRALDRLTGTFAALKVLWTHVLESPEQTDRFTREALLLQELRHPGIVRYIAHGRTAEGEPYLALEWLEGFVRGYGGAALVVSVSCVGRRLVLGERTEEEVESVLESAPTGTSHVGFYSYGEISPGAAGGASDLHNQTMTVTVFSER